MRLYELVLALPSKRVHDEANACQLRWHMLGVVVVGLTAADGYALRKAASCLWIAEASSRLQSEPDLPHRSICNTLPSAQKDAISSASKPLGGTIVNKMCNMTPKASSISAAPARNTKPSCHAFFPCFGEATAQNQSFPMRTADLPIRLIEIAEGRVRHAGITT